MRDLGSLRYILIALFALASLAIGACSSLLPERIIVVTATVEPQHVAELTPVSITTLAPPSTKPTKPTVAPPTPTPTPVMRESTKGQGHGITAKFVYPDYSPAATSSLVFRLIAFKSDGPQADGAGIKEVEFRICRGDCDNGGTVVYHRTEMNAAYCSFGGGEPDCNVFQFSKGSTWPDTKTPVENGDYTVDAQVRPKSGDASWQGHVNFKIQLP
jgi:hypothetical protein